MMDPFLNWRDEDNKFLDIDVLNPRTHIKDGRAIYTDYVIHVKTNHPEFAIKNLSIRRRYSEFVWLKNRLGINDVMMTTPPSLPGKRIIGRFSNHFLKKRQFGLQNFMNKVVEINAFLSDPALHLFLQTDLPIDQMENYLRHGGLLSNVRDKVVIYQKNREQKLKEKESQETLSHSCSSKDCNLKRTLSLDSVKSMKKIDPLDEKDGGGRGWSRYIGDGYCSWEVTMDKDVTDFSLTRRLDFRQNKKVSTAYVLPGGQLRLADDINNKPTQNSITIPRIRSNSWHGNTSDIIDLLVESYDVVTPPHDASSEMGSMTFSLGSKHSNSGTWHYDSSDDGIEIDMSQRLAEYTIISMPITARNNFTTTENGFHHSLSASYEN